MGYEKQTFIDKETVLKAEHLERMENGIIGAEEMLCVTVALNDGISGEHGSISATTETTFAEMQLAYECGKLPYVKLVFSDGESVVLNFVKYYGDAMVFSNAVGAAAMSDVDGYAFAATISSSGDVDISWDVLGSGGVSSWNDLTDKPFYEEGSTEVLFPEEDISFSPNTDYGLYFHGGVKPFSLELGETYTVLWDEKEYVCTAFDATDLVGGIVIGNGLDFGLPGNNEPFAIATDETAIVIFVLDPTDTRTVHKVGIFKGTATIKTLDAKFLPMDAIDERIEAYISEALEGEY